MSNSLMIYLNKRLKEEKSLQEDQWAKPGPVITISREVGCEGLKIAHLIAKKLNSRKPATDWKVLSKEIFYESAKELNLEPERIQKIFKQDDKYTFDEILKAFNNRQFKSERRIVNTVADVVRSFAFDGFSIIVGRGGHIVASEIENALHIRLVAPLEYRIQTVMANKQMSREEASSFIQKVEKERITFRTTLGEEKLKYELFDLTINRASFANEELINLIECAIDKKKMLSGFGPKMEYY